MIKPLRVLILEDSQSDTLLLLRELRRGGFEVDYIRVDNANDLRVALRDRDWDIILSDYSMPSFDAPAALEIVQELGIDLPFIIISGTVGEDAAVAAMKAGASDFFAKGKLARLVPIVERELREASGRIQRREAEARFTTAFEASPIGIAISRLADGRVVDVNSRFIAMFGYSRESIIGKNSADLTIWGKPEQREAILHDLANKRAISNVEIEVRHVSGRIVYALLSAAHVELDNVPCILSMIHDITERRDAEQALRASEAKFRLLAENSTDMISRHTPDGVYRYVSPACRTLLGYEPEELLDHSAFDFFHPDDIDAILELRQMSLTIAGPDIGTVVYRIRHKNGNYIWFETTSHTIRNSITGDVIEIQSASRDITQRHDAEQSLTRYAQRIGLLHEIDRAILMADQPQVIAEFVLTRLQSLMGFESATVSTFDSDLNQIRELASIAPIENYRPYDDQSIIDLLRDNQVYGVDDLCEVERLLSSEHALIAAGIRSYVRIPLVASGKLLGSFNLRSKSPNAFSPLEIDVAQEVAAQLAIAIENARLLEVEQRRNRELTALHQASLQLTSSLELEQVLQTILDYAIKLVGANEAYTFLYDGETLTVGAEHLAKPEQGEVIAAARRDVLHGVASNRGRLVVSDVSLHPDYRDWRETGAIIGLPLKIVDQVNGVMALVLTEPHYFNDLEVRLLELLADQAAIAIHNAQLYQQIRSHAEELEQRVLTRTAELQASEMKYRTLIEFAPDSIVIVDQAGVITLANNRTESFFGYLQQELIGQSVEMLLPGVLRDVHIEHRENFMNELTQRAMGPNLDLVARHKNGAEIPVKIGLSPIRMGTETLIMAYVVDISAEKQLEDGLRTALAKEKELNELKTSFTSIVSHEFRTPLSVILSSTELLTQYSDRMDPERRLEKLTTIDRQVKRLVQLLDDVLTITRAESTGFQFKPTSLDLVALSTEIIEELQLGYGQGVEIELAHQGVGDLVKADEFLFSHILQNLTSNAIKYSRAGEQVQVALTRSAATLELVVEDHGIGIPERHQDRLFEAFHRAANVGSIQGTGIGLTIVKRAVDAYGGTITFESVEGEGTSFTVRLPIPD